MLKFPLKFRLPAPNSPQPLLRCGARLGDGRSCGRVYGEALIQRALVGRYAGKLVCPECGRPVELSVYIEPSSGRVVRHYRPGWSARPRYQVGDDVMTLLTTLDGGDLYAGVVDAVAFWHDDVRYWVTLSNGFRTLLFEDELIPPELSGA